MVVARSYSSVNGHQLSRDWSKAARKEGGVTYRTGKHLIKIDATTSLPDQRMIMARSAPSRARCPGGHILVWGVGMQTWLPSKTKEPTTKPWLHTAVLARLGENQII